MAKAHVTAVTTLYYAENPGELMEGHTPEKAGRLAAATLGNVIGHVGL